MRVKSWWIHQYHKYKNFGFSMLALFHPKVEVELITFSDELNFNLAKSISSMFPFCR